MANTNPAVGQPVRDLQTFLRQISIEWEGIPLVIPDGIYGEQTHQAVSAFQQQSGLPVTGETDSETWNRLRAEYEYILRENSEPEKMAVYPGPKHTFSEDDCSIYLIPIQAILYVLSTVYPQLGTLEINGTYDSATCNMVKKLQKIFGQEQTGILNKHFWNILTGMYENLVSRNSFYDQNGGQI